MDNLVGPYVKQVRRFKTVAFCVPKMCERGERSLVVEDRLSHSQAENALYAVFLRVEETGETGNTRRTEEPIGSEPLLLLT